jgi:hypothetical protein
MVDDDVHIVTKDEASEIRARREFTAGLNEARRQFTKTIDAKDAEIACLRKIIDDWEKIAERQLVGLRQNSEEVARLREALTGVRKDLAPIHMCDVVYPGCKICDAVLRIDAALAPRESNLKQPVSKQE